MQNRTSRRLSCLIGLAAATFLWAAPGNLLAGSVARFSDINYYDLNGDSQGDIFSTRTLTIPPGQVVRGDLLDPAHVAAFFPVIFPASFETMGTGNFDSDPNTSEIVARRADGTLYFVGPVGPDFTTREVNFAHVSPDFSLVGIGRVDADEVDDLVFFKRFGTGGSNDGVLMVALISETMSISNNLFPAVMLSDEIPIGVGNFDGADGGDIAVFNTMTRNIRVIRLSSNGSTFLGNLTPMTVPAGYTVFATGAFNADAQLDYLLHAATTPVANLLRIDFTAAGGGSTLTPAFPAILPANATPVATGNFDNSGPTDFMGRYTSGGATGHMSQYLLSIDGSGSVSTITFPFGLFSASTVLQNHAVLP